MTDEKQREDFGASARVQALSLPPLSPGVFPDLTAPSIFFHGVTAHSFGSGGFTFSLEVQRPNQTMDGSKIAERVHAGALRCADLVALRQLKCSVDTLIFAAEKGAGGDAPN